LKRLVLDQMDGVAAIHRKAFDEGLPWLAGVHTPQEDRAFFRDQAFSKSEVWGTIDEQIIGFIAFHEDWIGQLYILLDRQGKGVGRALLHIAKSRSASLLLWTFKGNGPARQFYERNGFVAVEETDGSRNEEHEPDILYRWSRPSEHDRA
jgi:GNAT superfamily N-acetyltransferase